ncbi:MAG: capsular biosynthesis protein [Lachnospiraceae bacterium]|nr:capsular biosynthesis protein [Lachnospiraceae bacterium]
MDIDFVLAWVDGSDNEWQKEKAQYCGKNISEDGREERYRDWDILKFWFRGVEKYASWVNKIFFVTWGHLPSWLDIHNPKLEIVNHASYIPGQFLPTFNSHTIELNFHRIKGLSEQFVYFNDDFFIINPVKQEDFFVNGVPKDMLALQPVVANVDNPVMPYIYLNNSMLLAKHFDKRSNIKKHPGSYFHIGYPFMYFFYNMLEMAFPRFTGFYTVHGPSPFLKSTFETIWQEEGDFLSGTCMHKFRDKEDASQYLIREWQKLSGNFKPANVKKLCRYFELGNDNRKLYNTLMKKTCKMVCINDANTAIDFNKVQQELATCFNSIFPVKSSYEL